MSFKTLRGENEPLSEKTDIMSSKFHMQTNSGSSIVVEAWYDSAVSCGFRRGWGLRRESIRGDRKTFLEKQFPQRQTVFVDSIV